MSCAKTLAFAFVLCTLLAIPLTGAARQRAACTISGTAGDDRLGTNGPDVICGKSGRDRIYGERGDDILRGGSGADALKTGRGADSVFGSDDDDLIFGEGGPGDVLRGGQGDDTLYSGRASDRLVAGPGRDFLAALSPRGAGVRDVLIGGTGADNCLWSLDGSPGDTLRGGPGRDVSGADSGDRVHTVEIRHRCFTP